MNAMDDDYTEGDRYDWDQSDDSQYCRHGTFIGSWWGPDLLCGFCEDGTTDEEFAEYQRRLKHDRLVELTLSHVYRDLAAVIPERRDQLRVNPGLLGEWYGHVIDEVKASDDATLERYLTELVS